MTTTVLPTEHPLILGYQKMMKLPVITETTKIPMGILVPVFRDYTGAEMEFDRRLYQPETLVPFGKIFSPGFYQ